MEALPTWIVQYAQAAYDPPPDGNCGYHCLAHALAFDDPDGAYSTPNGWLQVRQDLVKELDRQPNTWKRLLGAKDIQDVRHSIYVSTPESPVGQSQWLSRLDAGPLAAEVYNRPIVFLTCDSGSITFLPISKAPGPKPKSPIFLCFMDGCHWFLLNVKRGTAPFPLPMVSRAYAKTSAGPWLQQIEASTKLYSDIT